MKLDSESADLHEKKNWLRHNHEPQHMVRTYMTDTRPMRCQWVHGNEQPAVHEVFVQYPRLADPDGYIWVLTLK